MKLMKHGTRVVCVPRAPRPAGIGRLRCLGELTQVAETAVQMRKDLLNLGCVFYKNHRVYQKTIA